MTTQTVRVDNSIVGYRVGSYLTVDDAVPLIAALIAHGHLTIATPPANVTAVPSASAGLSLGDLQDPNSPASLSLRAAYAALDEPARQATLHHPIGHRLTKVGAVLSPGPTGAFDSAIVESLNPFRDPVSGRIAGVYTGYTGTYASPGAGGIGLAFSDEGVYWQKAGQILGPSNIASSPDMGTVTGPLVRYENGTYYLFYIGASQYGYEQGTKSICLATATSLTGTWTRQGAIISPGGGAWRNYPTNPAVWHPNIVKYRGIYYMFFNANNSAGNEVIGYATAASLMGPWTVDDVNSPVLPLGLSTSGEAVKNGDPAIHRVGDLFVMDYFGINSAATFAGDYQAVTTTSAFPLGWKRSVLNPVLVPTAGGIDSKFAHKPCVFIDRGKLFHYYTADNGTVRQIALAVSADPPTTSAYSVLDSFVRTSGTALGTADSGQVWASDAGWGLDGTHAAWTGTADGNAIIDAAVSDNFAMRFRLVSVVAAGYTYGVQIRYSSASVYTKIYKTNSGTWNITVNGATSQIGVASPLPAAGDLVEVQVRGKVIRVLVNDVEQASYVYSGSPQAFTKHGLVGSANTGLTVDQFSIRPL